MLRRSLLQSARHRGGMTVIDFTTGTLDAKLSFTRAGTRNAIVNGVVTNLANNVPAFESWDGVARGLSIEGSFTNLLTQSNNLADASWLANSLTKSTGGTAPDGSSTAQKVVEVAATAVHEVKKRPGSQSGNQCYSVFVHLPGGVTRWAGRLRMSAEFDNGGPTAFFMLEGTPGHFVLPDSTKVTLGTETGGVQKLANGWFRVWISGTWGATGNKEYALGPIDQTQTGVSFAGDISQSIEFFGAQVNSGFVPSSYVATAGATASNTAESLIWTSPPSLTQGTFIIEHDATSGALIGSGASAIVSASVAGKTAFAWDGSSSDLVNNGGSTAAGGAPTFTDLRILGTSAGSNNAHITKLTLYPTRLSVAQMQALTTTTVVSTATPGVLRTVALQNRMPGKAVALAGSVISFYSRFKFTLGGFDVASMKADFANFVWATAAANPAGQLNGNSVVIDELTLERETGVSEFAAIRFAGNRSITLSDGAFNQLSDAILPASFTGLSVFPANSVWWIRVKGHIASAGNVPGARWGAETGAQAFAYAPASTTVSATDATGVFTTTGTAPTSINQGVAPILVGIPASGDPRTFFLLGDSIIEGTGSLHDGTFVRKSLADLGVPSIEFAVGGKSQASMVTGVVVDWTPYLAYARVLADEMGTNDTNLPRLLNFFKYWNTAKATYHYDKMMHIGLLPSDSSTDNFATEANQTIVRTYKNNIDYMLASAKTLGYLDANIDPQSVRGVNLAKWIVNGSANYATSDGTHQVLASDELLHTEVKPLIDAVTVT